MSPSHLRSPIARWRLPPPVPAELMHEYQPVVAQVLASRGVSTPAAARSFLSWERRGSDPFQMTDMDRAVERIRHALEADTPIAVYGDYDADGISGAAIVIEALRSLGATVLTYIPHRERDGYGVRPRAIETLHARGAGVVITVDCGIRAVDAVERANDLGLDVIVTDHHILPDRLPPATAILNPKREDAGFPGAELSGAGVALMLARGVLNALGGVRRARAADLHEEDLLDLVALGTVADVVPLVGENRALVHAGLRRMRVAPRPGISALAAVSNVDLATVTARDLGWSIGPRINAAGRMGDAEPALRTLLAIEEGEARRLAEQLDAHNRARRAATDVALAQAADALADDIRAGAALLAWPSEDVAFGVAGLVAGRLVRSHYRPAVVMRTSDGRARGSVRSIPELDAVELLGSADDLLTRWGGHAGAGGLTAPADAVPAIIDRFQEFAERRLAGRELTPEIVVDAEAEPARLDWALHGLLEKLEPFGEGNPNPHLLIRNVPVIEARSVGAEGDHLKMQLAAGPTGRIGAIAFGQGGRRAEADGPLDVVGRLKSDAWRGVRRLELEVEDFRRTGG